LEEECVVELLRFVSDCAWNTSTKRKYFVLTVTQLTITVDGQTSQCEGDDSLDLWKKVVNRYSESMRRYEAILISPFLVARSTPGAWAP
jgi:hypothetical protein